MTKMQGLIYNDNGHDIALATADGSLCLGTFTPLNTDGAEAFKRLVDAANLSAGADLPAFVAELEATKPSAGHFTDTCPLDKRFTAVYVEHSLIAMAETLDKADRLVLKLNAVPALIALIRQLQGERDQSVMSPVYQQIKAERYRQDDQWGESNHADGTGDQYIDDANIARIILDSACVQGLETWQLILRKWFFKAISSPDAKTLRKRLVQVAAVSVAWIECIDRKEKAMSEDKMDDLEGYKYCWKCYEKAHGFIPDQWNPWIHRKCKSCGISTECFRSPTDWEKKNVLEPQSEREHLRKRLSEADDEILSLTKERDALAKRVEDLELSQPHFGQPWSEA